MVTLSPRASRYWTLPQAIAWVIYRREDIVDYVGPNGGGSLGLVAMYPTHFQQSPEIRGVPEELRRAAAEGRLKVTGIPSQNSSARVDIPPEEWLRLQIYSGKVYRVSEEQSQLVYPWREMAVESADMKRLWRSDHELSGRSKFDWASIKLIFDELKIQNPQMSQNELMIETQGTYRDQFNKEPPGRTTIQNKIKTWA